MGKNALIVTDRTVWQNKLERIPTSLITDCHVDTDSPKMCYFTSETVDNQYQVLVFLCKSSDDARKLVDACPSRLKVLHWYNASTSSRSPVPNMYHLSMRTGHHTDTPPFPTAITTDAGLKHSTLERLDAHSNNVNSMSACSSVLYGVISPLYVSEM